MRLFAALILLAVCCFIGCEQQAESDSKKSKSSGGNVPVNPQGTQSNAPVQSDGLDNVKSSDL